MNRQSRACCFVVDARLVHNGSVYWDPLQSFPEGHWQESLSVFNEVIVLARTRSTQLPSPTRGCFPPEVRVGEFPYYVGPLAAARQSSALLQVARYWARQDKLFILRVPGFLPIVTWFWLRRYGKPYAVEVLGDISEAYRVIRHPLGWFWRVFFSYMERTICYHADAVLYVSQALERVYPARSEAETVVASDVRLTDAVFAQPRIFLQVPVPVQIIHVGNMEQPYKGHEILLEALAICQQMGVSIQATLIGEGRLRSKFECLAQQLGLDGQVTFQGTVPWGDVLFAMLDQADLFVFPSLTEGLSKALLEAMARGLPAIGTTVGGIPELLPLEVLVPPGDAQKLAEKIMTVVTSPEELTRLSARNYETALNYRHEVLSQKRIEFYLKVKKRLYV